MKIGKKVRPVRNPKRIIKPIEAPDIFQPEPVKTPLEVPQPIPVEIPIRRDQGWPLQV